MQGPASEPFRPTIPLFDPEAVASRSREALEQAREMLAQIESGRGGSAAVLDAWDDTVILLENVFGPISLLNSVHPDKAVRDACDDALVAESNFLTEAFQSEAFFQRVTALEPERPEAAKLRQDLLEGFEDSGVSLPQDRRRRFREIAERSTEIGQEFAKNIRENAERMRFTEAECAGLPESWLARAKRDEEGNVIVGFDYPDYVPFMMNAHDADARRRYWVANTRRGTAANLALLDEMTQLRQETARLYDLPSFAHYVTRRNMAGSPERVREFLNAVREVVTGAEIRDLAELAALKAELTGVADAKIERWDVSYYRERLRERRFAIDQEALRRHFPTAACVEWMLAISAALYGLRFERTPVPVWHEDVIHLDVFDEESGAFIGSIYLDLYPREGKYKHAAAWPVRGVGVRAGRTPISVLVTNFDRGGLTHDELETLLHEFGHVLHGVLSTTWYVSHSGTSVESDFVEAPSQMFEEWALRTESLALLRNHCPDCPPIDRALVERLDAAKRFGAGIDYGRQLLYAAFDMELCSEAPAAALGVWSHMEGGSPLGHVDGTEFPGTFEHIVGGYAAGYYGYMWAKAIALDLLTAFEADIMSREAGRRFRREILERGSEAPAQQLVERFLGRGVATEAFFRHITGR